MKNVYINKIETSVPLYECQNSYKKFIPHIFEERTAKKISRIIESCEIDCRYSVLENIADGKKEDNTAFYQPDKFPKIGARMEAYRKHALPLSLSAINNLNLTENEKLSITHLIVHSCTGYYAPGLDIEIIQELGLSTSINRTLIGHMGCYAAFPAMKLAKDIVLANKNAVVLMVGVELCTLHFSSADKANMDQIISSMIFADGASALIISEKNIGIKIDDFYSTLIPSSKELMKWQIRDDAFAMVLDSSIPLLIGNTLKDKAIISKFGNDVDFWCIHPGGKTILDQIEDSLALSPDSLNHSRAILRNYGNMSSVTVLFVLKRFLDKGQKGAGVAMGFGPGLVLESMKFSI